MSRLKDKIVLITGASSGLGAQIAFQAAERQAVVVLTARRRDPLETAAKRCQELSGRAVYTYQLDVGSTEQISEVMQKIAVEVGPVDVLVNNA
ncbi:MAG: SDR family NAD(P)-dependent oxidoreductase, partial [Firmicutes bacterium]|nr:SDR family NAD(P)-dependent oxidoreductase [Bacillota bacterium]